MAGYGVELSKAISEGWLLGPHMFSAVIILSLTTSHGDVHNMSLEDSVTRIRHGLPFQLCDGVSEHVKAVRPQIRRGAQVIKVAASGGASSLIDDPQMEGNLG